MRTQVRSIFVSDSHLGHPFAKRRELLEFLYQHQAEYLYLVGDIIDAQNLRAWTDDCTLVVRQMLSYVKRGAVVRYAIGNHDELLRKYVPVAAGALELKDQFIHVAADNRRLLVLHGDRFDPAVCRPLYWIGAVGYNFLLRLNVPYNFIRRLFGLRYWSLAKAAKTSVKRARWYSEQFEKNIAASARRCRAKGVVCGHIHIPKIAAFEEIEYYNCGDWLEDETALIEDFDGQLHLAGPRRDAEPPTGQAPPQREPSAGSA